MMNDTKTTLLSGVRDSVAMRSPQPRLVGTKAASKYLCISDRKLWQLTADKRIPAVRFDRVLRYDIADLDAFIASMKGESR